MLARVNISMHTNHIMYLRSTIHFLDPLWNTDFHLLKVISRLAASNGFCIWTSKWTLPFLVSLSAGTLGSGDSIWSHILELGTPFEEATCASISNVSSLVVLDTKALAAEESSQAVWRSNCFSDVLLCLQWLNDNLLEKTTPITWLYASLLNTIVAQMELLICNHCIVVRHKCMKRIYTNAIAK